MSDSRTEEYYSDECSKCSKYNRCDRHYKSCNKNTRRSRSCSPDKCSTYNDCDCDCYDEPQYCESYKKCKCRRKPRNQCEKKCCNCSSYKICKKKEKYDVCNKIKTFEESLFNAKNEKIFFITIG